MFLCGAWKYVEVTDPFTDADTSYVYSSASQHPALAENAAFVIRCADEDESSYFGIRPYIEFDEFLNNESRLTVQWRFDDGEVHENFNWRMDTTGTAAFIFQTLFHQMLSEMLQSNRMVVRTWDYRGTPYTYDFPVHGLGEALTVLGCYKPRD